jgi:SWI/SNF-related matrix-associated actin-dependent regulator 1 of chromatin subfamily A
MCLSEPANEAESRVFRALRRAVREKVNLCPYPYQFKGIYGIEKTRGRALVADDMGLGKSLQALGWTALYPERRPVLIVCPATLKFNWQNEINTHLSKDSIMLSGKKPYKFPQHEYVIINYDILEAWVPEILKHIKPQIVICDEFHYCKSRKAQRTKATIKLSKKVSHFIGLTGTPIDNRPVELFPQLKAIDKDLFPSFWDFGLSYCAAEMKFGRWEFKGASKSKELHKILSTKVMIRRKKSEVLTELPDKTRTALPLSICMKEYNKAEVDLIGWLKKVDPLKAARAKNAEALAKIGYLKRLAAKGKVKEVIKWVENFLENTDEKLILFAIHHEVLDALRDAFGPAAVMLTGKTSAPGRRDAVDRFQNDPKIRIFIGGLKAAGVGLTLTAASTVAMVELGWTPAEHLQAEDRAHRIGQKNAVNCYYFLAQGTIEEPICDMIQAKQKVIEQVLDGREEVQDWNVYENLVKSLQRRK